MKKTKAKSPDKTKAKAKFVATKQEISEIAKYFSDSGMTANAFCKEVRISHKTLKKILSGESMHSRAQIDKCIKYIWSLVPDKAEPVKEEPIIEPIVTPKKSLGVDVKPREPMGEDRTEPEKKKYPSIQEMFAKEEKKMKMNFPERLFVSNLIKYLFVFPLLGFALATVFFAWVGVFRWLHHEGYFLWLMTLNGLASLN